MTLQRADLIDFLVKREFPAWSRRYPAEIRYQVYNEEINKGSYKSIAEYLAAQAVANDSDSADVVRYKRGLAAKSPEELECLYRFENPLSRIYKEFEDKSVQIKENIETPPSYDGFLKLLESSKTEEKEESLPIDTFDVFSKPEADTSNIKNEPKQLSTRERDTLLKIIIGMAVKGYSYDPKASKNSTAKEVSDDLASLGISITDDTVRKWLKEATQLLPQNIE